MHLLRQAVAIFILLSFVTGIAYPLLVTGIAQLLLPHQANGSLIGPDGRPAPSLTDGRVVAVASVLIGQEFAEGPRAPEFFWGRRSATGPVPYTAFHREALTGSSGSNMGPANPALVDAVRGRVDALSAADAAVGFNRSPGTRPPIDLLTASGSGLDPHISPASAEYQLPRVARARALSESVLHEMLPRHTQGRWLGIFGEPVVNVVTLNRELEAMVGAKATPTSDGR